MDVQDSNFPEKVRAIDMQLFAKIQEVEELLKEQLATIINIGQEAAKLISQINGKLQTLPLETEEATKLRQLLSRCENTAAFGSNFMMPIQLRRMDLIAQFKRASAEGSTVCEEYGKRCEQQNQKKDGEGTDAT